MLTIRTDLAQEAHSLWRESAGETTRLAGVKARDSQVEGFPLHRVEILDEAGERALGKPRGVYLTLDMTAFWRREPEQFSRLTAALAQVLSPLLPEEGPVLVAGLGNPAMTPDALGPLVMGHLLITRHLGQVLPTLRPVAALAAGVLGTTGLEVAEWVRGAAERVEPAAVVLVDALAARGLSRLCSTIQVSDTGLIPGSGVGNHRMALNRETLGVPVFAIGVPTVVDSATLAADILEESGVEKVDEERLRGEHDAFMVTTRDIDQQVRDLSKVVGYGINWALQDLEIEEMNALLS